MDFAAGNDEVRKLLHKRSEWHDQRRKGIGGSDASKIMDGEWRNLWLEKTGRAESEDLSNNLAVAMGTWTETLNRYWFTQQTGIQVNVDTKPAKHSKYKFMRANLDGRILFPEKAVFEAKHVNSFTKDEQVVSRYYAQCQHLMEVTGVDICYLSVFFGSMKWAYFDIARDDAYISELITSEEIFWSYVDRDEMPPDAEPAAPVLIKFDEMREVDLSTSNAWCAFAADWLKNKEPAKIFDTACAELKSLVEPDVKRASGAGVHITRAKNGALTLKEDKE